MAQLVKNLPAGRARWRRSRWTWSISLSTDTSGIHLQTQKCMQNTSWEGTGVTDQRNRIYSDSDSEITQSCPILCDPMDSSQPSSSIYGIFQARILEWAAISFSRGSSRLRDWTQVSHIVGRHFTVWATREGQRIYRTTQNSVGWTRGENKGVSRTRPALGRWRNWSRGPIPTLGAIVWVRRKTFKADSESAELWQPRWNENQTVLAAATHTPDMDTGPLEGAVAGSWSLGIVEQSQGKGCCWLWRDRWRGGEEGDCGGKCLWRKAGQPWKQGDTAESHLRDGAITRASSSPHTSIGSWTIERLAHQTPDTLNYRAGPHPGCSFKWLICQTTE